jgi:riboflavin synthase
MFTGIVEAKGQVRFLKDGRLVLDLIGIDGFDWVIGESVAVNGCCLTMVDFSDGLHFELSPETLTRTSLGWVRPGARVNLERAMPASGRFGGHIVQGHVDATGTLLSITAADNASVLRFQAPKVYDRYLIDKGSIAIDGISLTIVDPKDGVFEVWVIPHTLHETNLAELKPGDDVNLEFDVVAKYVERLTARQA